MYILIAIIFFGLLIFVHELGHFAAAKLNGIGVYEFNMGMGPKLFSFKRKETAYNLRLLPIGGSIQMVGEDDENYSPNSFTQKSIWRRVTVLFCGPAMNFVLAIIAFIVLYMMVGVATGANVVGSPVEDTPAIYAGLQGGDVIKAVNEIETADWSAVVDAIKIQPQGKEMQLTVVRGEQELKIFVAPYIDEASQESKIGILPQTKHYSVFSAIGLGFRQAYEFTRLLLVSLFQMITGKLEAELAGPVGIVNIVGQAAQFGFPNLLMLLGVLSINLGVVNLLPVPALDGSRIVFLGIEKLRGKPMNPNREGFIHFVGLMALFGLMIFITYQDIARLING